MNTTPAKLLDIPEAAARLHVCNRTYYRLVATHQLPPPLKIGGKSLALEADIETFIAQLIRQRGTSGITLRNSVGAA